MEKEEKILFKCANDLNVKVTKCNGEVILEEDCCTSVSIILKNSGEIATSFHGSHNPQLVKVLERTLKNYFKSIKKTLKQEYKQNTEDDIKVMSEDLPENSKWNGQPVPDVEVEKEENKNKSKETKPKENSKTNGKNMSKTNSGAKKKQPTNKSAISKRNSK